MKDKLSLVLFQVHLEELDLNPLHISNILSDMWNKRQKAFPNNCAFNNFVPFTLLFLIQPEGIHSGPRQETIDREA